MSNNSLSLRPGSGSKSVLVAGLSRCCHGSPASEEEGGYFLLLGAAFLELSSPSIKVQPCLLAQTTASS